MTLSLHEQVARAVQDNLLLKAGDEITELKVTSDHVFSARVLRLKVFTSSEYAIPIVVKCNAPGQRMHGREVDFYQEIAPRSPAFLLAKCYASSFDAGSGEFLLILQDLSSSHEEYPSAQTSELTLQDAEEIVDTLSKFHRHWMDHPMLLREAYAGNRLEPGTFKSRIEQKHAAIKPQAEKIVAAVGEAALHDYARIADEYAEACCARIARGEAITLTHGDAHAGNFLKPRIKSESSVIIDWPNWVTGIATDDLVTLVSGWPPELQGERFAVLASMHREKLAVSSDLYNEDVALSAKRAFKLAVWNLAVENPPAWATALARTTHSFYRLALR